MCLSALRHSLCAAGSYANGELRTNSLVLVIQVWCHGCGSYQTVNHSKAMTTPATVLTVHCNASTEAELDLWRTRLKVQQHTTGKHRGRLQVIFHVTCSGLCTDASSDRVKI